jgi:co-chaperonin GroES (HSP10)
VHAIDKVLEGVHASFQPEVPVFNRLPNTDTMEYAQQSLLDAFPEGVDSHFRPLGSRLLVQMRRPQTLSKGGIALPANTQEDIKWNQQIAKVVRLGPLCFRNRESAELWPEGEWCKAGDFVRVPRWNGDRIVVDAPDGGLPVTFVCFHDYELIGVIEGDPLAVKVYIL